MDNSLSVPGATPGGMQPITMVFPVQQTEAIAAEVSHGGPVDIGEQRPGALVKVWIGPSLELVLTLESADRLADALVDALATDDEHRPVLYPAAHWGPGA